MATRDRPWGGRAPTWSTKWRSFAEGVEEDLRNPMVELGQRRHVVVLRALERSGATRLLPDLVLGLTEHEQKGATDVCDVYLGAKQIAEVCCEAAKLVGLASRNAKLHWLVEGFDFQALCGGARGPGTPVPRYP